MYVTNWSGEPLNIEQGTVIGDVEEVLVVDVSDPVWETPPVEVARIGQLLLMKHNSFPMKDSELGENDVVEHSIDTNSARPTKTFARRLPYALRKELEEELTKLRAAGCIEPSTPQV